MTEVSTDMQDSFSFFHFFRAAWSIWAIALVFAVGIFFSTFSLTGGSNGVEIGMLLAAGVLGGGLIRGFLRESWVTIVLVLVVVAGGFLLSQSPGPWSKLWPVLVPASAIGVMVGNVIRSALSEGSRKVLRDVWVVNGVEEPQTMSAKATSLAALSSWDSAESGRFFVERNAGLFEAMGSPATGFIVHCAANSQDDSEWRMLGSVESNEETVIRIPSGPAYAPSGAVVDLKTASRALSGFFHHRGPDPELSWTSGDAALDLKFG
ncbi:hypothetical protein M1D93_04210 [Arthrobacter sp. Z1-9]